MRYIKSCGFIVYDRSEGENRYLVIRGLNGDVGFPKGHVENGESELQTAVRELREETNVEVDVIGGFRREISYKLPRVKDAIKVTVYFLGRCRDASMLERQETEVLEACFMPYQQALDALTFDETKRILTEAERLINELGDNH